MWQARRGIAKHVADVRILGADRNRHTKTLQTMQRGSGSKGADVCGRLVFERGPKTEAARTCRGYARIAPDVPPATTELQRFKWKHRCGRAGCGRRGGQAKVYINSIVRGCGGTEGTGRGRGRGRQGQGLAGAAGRGQAGGPAQGRAGAQLGGKIHARGLGERCA